MAVKLQFRAYDGQRRNRERLFTGVGTRGGLLQGSGVAEDLGDLSVHSSAEDFGDLTPHSDADDYEARGRAAYAYAVG